MDTFDSYRSTVPARLPSPRSGVLSPRGSSGLPDASTTSTSPLSIRVALRGARRYWWLVLLLWVVGSAGIGAAVYTKVRPSYEAFGILRVIPASTDIYGVRTTGETFDPFLQTLVNLITSPGVLTAAASRSDAAALERVRTAGGDVGQELRKSINVGIIPGTYLIKVSMTSNDPNEAAILVNAVVKSFLASNSEWSDGMTTRQIASLETYLRELEGQTGELELRWKDIVKKGDFDTRMINLANQQREKAARSDEAGADRGSLTVDEFKRVKEGLFQVKMELVEAEAWLEAARTAARAGAATELTPAEERARVDQQVERRFRIDPEVVQLMAQIKSAQDKLDKVTHVARLGGDPAEQAARRNLKSLHAQWKNLWEARSVAIREEVEQAGGLKGPDQEVAEATTRVRTLQAKQAALKQTASSLEIDKMREATDSVDIALLLDKRENLKGMQDAVNRRLEQLKFEAKGETRILLVDDARPSSKPISDKRTTYLAMTPVGVLGTVLGLIVLLEIRAGRVADPDALSTRIKHEVFSIAPLPNIRPGDDPNDGKAEQRLARFVQSLDHLRVAICDGGSAAGEGRCVMITSATGGEGKTTLAAHLAARCANAGTSTLLVDADMRRASLGKLLDVPAGAGLGDVLGGDVDLDEALITVQAGGFHFLSAGTPGRDPSRVLKSARLSELLGRLRRTYDLVIVDTPPVLPVADALIIGRWADGAVMAARFDASRLPLVERASRQLALAGVPVLGVVVNGVRGQDSTYGNYAYSYNYPGRPDPSA